VKDGSNDRVLKVELNGSPHNHEPGQFTARKKKKEPTPRKTAATPIAPAATTPVTTKRKRSSSKQETPLINVQQQQQPLLPIKQEPIMQQQQQQQQQQQPVHSAVSIPVVHHQVPVVIPPFANRLQQPLPQQQQVKMPAIPPYAPAAFVQTASPLKVEKQPPTTTAPVKTPKVKTEQQQQLQQQQQQQKSTPRKRRSGGLNSGSDGYKWHKYGEKTLSGAGNLHKHYFRCTHPDCEARKFVTIDDNTKEVTVTYSCEHSHPAEAVSHARNRDKQQQSSSVSGVQP